MKTFKEYFESDYKKGTHTTMGKGDALDISSVSALGSQYQSSMGDYSQPANPPKDPTDGQVHREPCGQGKTCCYIYAAPKPGCDECADGWYQFNCYGESVNEQSVSSFDNINISSDSYVPSPYDMEVVNAFFEGRPNVVGDEIMTVSSEDGDFTKEDIRIDLINGRARKAMALYSKGILSLANPGEMIDKTPHQTYFTNTIRNLAKQRDIRVIG